MRIISKDIEIPIFELFSFFVMVSILKTLQERQIILKILLLTYQILILEALSFQKNIDLSINVRKDEATRGSYLSPGLCLNISIFRIFTSGNFYS